VLAHAKFSINTTYSRFDFITQGFDDLGHWLQKKSGTKNILVPFTVQGRIARLGLEGGLEGKGSIWRKVPRLGNRQLVKKYKNVLLFLCLYF